MDELVTVKKIDLEMLIRSDIILDALQSIGIDAWSGYGVSTKILTTEHAARLGLDPTDPTSFYIVLHDLIDIELEKLTNH